MAQITLEKVGKKFKAVQAVWDLNLVIRDGEFFTFVGPSGCGKSTVLHLIAGLEEVSTGQICFDRDPVNAFSPKERDVAMVFQNYALYPHLTVFENMAFPLRMRKASSSLIEMEVKRVSDMLGLSELLSRKPRELSGGQRQRVALGRAIVRKPRVFLMDEPLSNLDARLRVDMRAELKRLHQALKITTVYVTHDQAEALSLSDRIAVINQGRIEQCGTPKEIYENPANLFVAGFIGSPPMNLIPARVAKENPLEIDCFGHLIRPPLTKISLGQKIVLGLRPEAVTVSKEPSTGSLEGEVNLVEPTGSFHWIGIFWKGINLRGITNEKIEDGQKAFFQLPPDKLIYFNEETEKRL
jgi:multiple sugar transport system ATP-binding protein